MAKRKARVEKVRAIAGPEFARTWMVSICIVNLV